ncbi:MAG TPA: non-homologous end-joining DNA ligase [Microthrixaceae bacterium]|nr:non-homologous end-joining DNA ligase [Microthrixaceae bacterium]
MSALPALEPMKAIAGELPTDDDAWAYEIKWDGMRALAFVEGGAVRLRSTRRNDVAVGYPELAALGDAVHGRPAVLDGEVVAFDEEGRPSFAMLQGRMHVSDAAAAAQRAAVVPVVYIVFDLLHFDGVDCWQLPYLERRRLLGELVQPGSHWQVPSHQVGGGAELLAAADDRGLEGVVAKRPQSAYEPGRRSASWRKVKVRRTQEFVVGGWTEGGGNRSGHLGSLMLGCHTGDRLGYVGNVGTGFSQKELARLGALLDDLAIDDCPFDRLPVGPNTRGAHWVRPELVVQTSYGEWTPEGRLRHPVYLGQRTDKLAAEVTCDP